MADEIVRIRIPATIYKKVQKAAEKEDRTIAYVLRRAICERFESRPEETQRASR